MVEAYYQHTSASQSLLAMFVDADTGKRWNGSAMAAHSTIADADRLVGLATSTNELTGDSTPTTFYNFTIPALPAGYYIIWIYNSPYSIGDNSVGRYYIKWSGTAIERFSVAGSTVVMSVEERNAIVDALLDRTDGIETGVTPRQGWQRIGAIIAGKVSGAGTGTEVFVGLDGVTTRATATVDVLGNRTNWVYV